MNKIPEEHEPWVLQLKSQWPDPGPAPRIQPVPDPAPRFLKTGWAVAAAVGLVLLAGWWIPRPVTASAVTTDWPEFEPRRRPRIGSAPSPTFFRGDRSEEPSGHTFLPARTRVRVSSPPNNWSTLK